MATYKPVGVSITSAAISGANGGKISKDVVNAAWNLVFIYGTAKYSTVKLSNATVLGWYSALSGTFTTADIQTFTDANGRYGITVDTGHAITLKVYSHE